MANYDLQPAGSDLFSGSESFMSDLSQEDESMIAGGSGKYYNKGKSKSESKSKSKSKSKKYKHR